MPAVRALPARPNLEFEKKAAKTLLKRLREGDPDARARAELQHAELGGRAAGEFKLADAQLVTAREYGFASWPKLVRYYDDLDRQARGRRTIQWAPIARHVTTAQGLLREHRAGRVWAGRALAAYAPRFYGLPLAEVFRAAPTLEEAYLVAARMQGEPSWEALKERSGPEPESPDPIVRELNEAIGMADLPHLQAVLAARPDLLHRPDLAAANGWRIGKVLVHHDRRMPRGRLDPILAWLATQGFDYQRELDLQLSGHMRISTEKVRWLLERGADPAWCAPNGIPVLEHALILYWNGAAVDVLAAHARPRTALWISAGLGDLEGVTRSLDGNGRPTAEATRLRPPFDAVGGPAWAAHPEPDVEELLAETLFVAAVNSRTAVIEHLAARGAPVDSMIFGAPLLSVAVGNAWVPVVEALLRVGASLDIRGYMPERTPRELAKDWFRPDDPARRKVAQLCGWDPDRLTAEHRDAE
ncbi:MAG TPA: hypothetical protein VG940_05295 [Gemmatimonadales bacterium]|nr:hypothetical protein [Gemmatimonadales bacterium]